MTSSCAGGQRRCQWCGASLAESSDKWCSKRCRQTAWRSRRLGVAARSHGDADPAPKRLAYADPPYPGLSKKYYGDQPSYAGEVDHAALIDKLRGYDGWALSTSRRSLRDVLALCPPGVVVCPWVKTHPAPDGHGPCNVHEYLIVSPGRQRRPGPPDALVASVARGGDSSLMGRKPLAFCAWLFSLLGAGPEDIFEDLFPGSGVVGRAWDQYRRACRGDASPVHGRRVAATGVSDASLVDPSVAATR